MTFFGFDSIIAHHDVFHVEFLAGILLLFSFKMDIWIIYAIIHIYVLEFFSSF